MEIFAESCSAKPSGRRFQQTLNNVGGVMALEAQLKDAEEKMTKAVQVSKEDFASLRAGRASPTLVEKITVDYYGSPTPLNGLAGISVPEARMLVISPYDRNALSAIEKAILGSDL